MMRIPGPKAILSRLILMLCGICLALLILEGALQIGAAFVSARPSVQPSWSKGTWRLLCLGDSNTFGVYVDRSQAYPKVVEALWNAEPGNSNVEVLNLGFPGTNSSRLVKDFRRMLWAFRPDVVTIMIGSNDWWTVPETAAESPRRIDRLALKLWKVSRVYRLLYMVRRAFQAPHLEVTEEPAEGFERGTGTARYGEYEFELGWTKVPKEHTPTWQVDLRKNIETLTAQTKEFGAKLIFLTYPSDSGPYSWANAVIREAARASETPFIDVAAALQPDCPGGKCTELFPDQHPTVAGHARVGRMLMQQLMSLPH